MRMYRVAICENELVQAQFLQKIMENMRKNKKSDLSQRFLKVLKYFYSNMQRKKL